MRRKTESEDFSTKRMQELPYDVRPHLMSYLPAEGLCHLIKTCRSFSEDLPQRDVRKLSFFFCTCFDREWDEQLFCLACPWVRRADKEKWGHKMRGGTTNILSRVALLIGFRKMSRVLKTEPYGRTAQS